MHRRLDMQRSVSLYCIVITIIVQVSRVARKAEAAQGFYLFATWVCIQLVTSAIAQRISGSISDATDRMALVRLFRDREKSPRKMTC